MAIVQRTGDSSADRSARVCTVDDFVAALKGRTEAIAKHLTSFIKDDPLGKTIVFCVDQEHAENMRAALNRYDHEKSTPPRRCRFAAVH